jgi:hypothetical protein
MTHSFPDFTSHVLDLLKNAGPTGPTGPTPSKPFIEKEKGGTSRRKEVGPVENDWCHHGAVSGPGKFIYDQTLSDGGTSGTSGTTNFRQGPAEPAAGAAPPEWYAILAELERQECPDWITIDRWHELLSDGDTFLSRWGPAAHSMGWTALDLFGVHPVAPAARFDVMGLLILTRGGPVVALMADGASIRRPSGALLNWRRCSSPGAALLSEVRL